MSLPIATTISGMESPEVLKQNLEIAKNFSPMPEQEMAEVRRRVRAKLLTVTSSFSKRTTKYDGKVGRQQHEYPAVEELPA